MAKMPDIHRILELQELLLAFSQVDRVVHRKHGDDFRLESDTEHSYNLALTAWYLAGFFPELDTDLVIKFALIHDLVEVHAGDTYIFADPEKLNDKHARETAALQKLKADWPDLAPLTELIEHYEKRDSKEAKFIYALDKIMPVMQIYINDGHTWGTENLTLTKLHEKKVDKVALSPEIEGYYEQLYDLLLKSPHLIKSK
jgi:putative hydrolases of HD superfamily